MFHSNFLEWLFNIDANKFIALIDDMFLCSRPDGKKKDRYYAKTLSDMDTVGLLCGEQRYAARTNLEDFIDGNISYNQLKANPRHWFWQSTRHPEMVILQKWFLGEQA